MTCRTKLSTLGAKLLNLRRSLQNLVANIQVCAYVSGNDVCIRVCCLRKFLPPNHAQLRSCCLPLLLHLCWFHQSIYSELLSGLLGRIVMFCIFVKFGWWSMYSFGSWQFLQLMLKCIKWQLILEFVWVNNASSRFNLPRKKGKWKKSLVLRIYGNCLW